MKEKGGKVSGDCDTEMKGNLVGRMAWEIGFVKIAQFFPETGRGVVQSYKVKKLCKKRLTFCLLCFKIENVKRARERFTQDKKIFSSFFKKRLDKQYQL